MMKTEYTENGGCLQRDSVEHKEYAEAYSTEARKTDEKDGADLLCKVLDRDNLNRAYKRVKANKGASGIDGMTVDEALPWLREHRDELFERIYRKRKRDDRRRYLVSRYFQICWKNKFEYVIITAETLATQGFRTS